MYAVTWLGMEGLSLVGGGTVHVREGEMGAQNSPHIPQYLKIFYIYFFYTTKSISKIGCCIHEHATPCCSNKPPPNPEYSISCSGCVKHRSAEASTKPSHSGTYQEAPSLYDAALSTNGFRKKGKENNKPAMKCFYLKSHMSFHSNCETMSHFN